MYKIRLLFSVLLAFMVAQASSQSIKLTVLDKQTKQGIPFASIIYLNGDKQLGGYTDSLGVYNIKKLDAELQISSIGYETLKISGNSIVNNLIIELTPIHYDLSTVDIKVRKTKIMRLGYFKDKIFDHPLGSSGFRGAKSEYTNYIAQFIPNVNQDGDLLISKLLYNLCNHPYPIYKGFGSLECKPTRLRLHLFTVDAKTGLPGAELLTRNIIFKNNCNQDNLIMDITEENIYLPKQGVFVGLEYVDVLRNESSSNFPFYVVNFKVKSTSNYRSYHQQKWELPWEDHAHKSVIQFGIEVIK